MKIDGVQLPKSSFLSIEKDSEIIVNRLCSNERFKRLLYYTTPDAIDKDNLNDEQMIELLQNNFKFVPKFYIDGKVLNYLAIYFSNFYPNATNPEFRDNTIEFDIICHFDQWLLKDFQQRPYRIAAEIDSMMDKTHLTGIGRLEFIGATPVNINDEYGGVCLMYNAIHGEEDKKFMPNPADEERFQKDFQDRTKR